MERRDRRTAEKEEEDEKSLLSLRLQTDHSLSNMYVCARWFTHTDSTEADTKENMLYKSEVFKCLYSVYSIYIKKRRKSAGLNLKRIYLIHNNSRHQGSNMCQRFQSYLQ